MIEPEKDFYAPWSTQPDEVKPMTERQRRDFRRKVKALMAKKAREEQEQRTGSDR